MSFSGSLTHRDALTAAAGNHAEVVRRILEEFAQVRIRLELVEQTTSVYRALQGASSRHFSAHHLQHR
jgi:hypothetical protein